MENAYKAAGVDIEAGEEVVERIKPLVKATERSGVMSGLGGFGALFDLKATGYRDPVLVSATDGVGTKIKIAVDPGIYDTVGIDLVAMCVNDLVVQGAEPLFFLDYFATGKLDVTEATAIIGGIAKGCEMAGCALIGGETAEMPGLYKHGDFDLAGFTVGAVEREDIVTGETVSEGDVILGLASDGLHSNGFSLVRKVVKTTQGMLYQGSAPFQTKVKTLGEALLTPTRIYVKPVLSILRQHKGEVKGMAHITGGGLVENIPRVLPEGLCAEIDCTAWHLPPIFKWLKEIGGLEDGDMSRTLNMGIGYVMIVSTEKAEEIKTSLEAEGETVYKIGTIRPRNKTSVMLLNQDKSWQV